MSRINHSVRAADLLEQAIAVLERDGWTKENYGDEFGRCSVGAIRFVAVGDADRHSRSISYKLAIDTLAERIRERCGNHGILAILSNQAVVEHWNDTTTEKEFQDRIHNMFMLAAKDLRNRAVAA